MLLQKKDFSDEQLILFFILHQMHTLKVYNLDMLVNRYKQDSNAAARKIKSDNEFAATFDITNEEIGIILGKISAQTAQHPVIVEQIKSMLNYIYDLNLLQQPEKIEKPVIKHLSLNEANTSYSAYIMNVIETNPNDIKNIIKELAPTPSINVQKNTSAQQISTQHLFKAQMWEQLLIAISLKQNEAGYKQIVDTLLNEIKKIDWSSDSTARNMKERIDLLMQANQVTA